MDPEEKSEPHDLHAIPHENSCTRDYERTAWIEGALVAIEDKPCDCRRARLIARWDNFVLIEDALVGAIEAYEESQRALNLIVRCSELVTKLNDEQAARIAELENRDED
jgi:hypothetical protein